MNQQEFDERYESQWKELAIMLDRLERKRGTAKMQIDVGAFPFLYRRACQQLALARDRDYAAHLIDRLNQLVLRGNQHLYQARAGLWSRFLRSVAGGFPALVRKNARLFWLATALLYAPSIVLALMIVHNPEFVYAVMEPGQVDNFEEMYRDDTDVFGRERASDTDFYMFGFYIRNNIGVGFRTFAGGLMFGLGTVFFLVFNGVYFGAVAGHLINVGYAETFFAFVIGHGALELTAIVLAGMAGLKLGWSLISPGRLSRLASLKAASRECVEIVYAVVVMLVLAAFLEAFWSSSSLLQPVTKFGVGAGLWFLVALYLLFAGRGRGT